MWPFRSTRRTHRVKWVRYGRVSLRRRCLHGRGTWRLRLGLVAFVLCGFLLTNSCATTPPKRQDNLCSVFSEKPKWFKAAAKSEKRWRVPIAVQMAFVQRESSFEARARPPRKKVFGVVPWKRPSSAYGYAQATNATWERYQKATRSPFADRNDFTDAVDFIGWYNSTSHKTLKIALTDAERLYLAYHEGFGGYAKGSYRRKPEVQRYANLVAQRATKYAVQLKGCRKKFERKRFFFF